MTRILQTVMVNFSVRIFFVAFLLLHVAEDAFAQEKVKNLIVQFKTGSPTVKRLVIKSLIGHKEPFLLPFFIELLGNEDATIRALSYEGLSRYPEPQVLSFMKLGFTDRSLFLKEHLLSLFSRFTSEEAINFVAPFLVQKQNNLRSIAARVLGHIGQLETTKFLAPALKSQDEELRTAALKAIVNIVRNNQNKLFADFDSEYSAVRKEGAFKRVSLVLNSTLPFIEGSLQSNRASRKEREYAASLFAIYSEFIPSKLETYSLFEETVIYLLKARVIIDKLQLVAESLTNAFSLQPPQVRALVLSSIWRYRIPEARQMLTEGLTDSFFLVRLTSIEGLSALRPPGLEKNILDLIHDKNYYVKTAALRALLPLSEDTEFTSSLKPLLKDPDPEIRWHAVKILGENQRLDHKTLTSLFSSSAEILRSAAVRYTPLLGDQRATRTIAERASKDISAQVREQGIFALATLKDSGVKTSLLASLLLDPELRVKRRAIEQLKNELDPLKEDDNSKIQKIIVGMLGDEDHYVRGKGAEILGVIGGQESVKPLRVLLSKDRNDGVIKSATNSLEQISLKTKTGRKR